MPYLVIQQYNADAVKISSVKILFYYFGFLVKRLPVRIHEN